MWHRGLQARLPINVFRCEAVGGAGGFASFPPHPPFAPLKGVSGGHVGASVNLLPSYRYE